jgi:uncharacterized protein YjeT (DUF2065 family)
MSDLWPALALVLVVEGLVLALVPHRLAELLRLVETLGPERLRTWGLGAASLGALLYWVLR